MDLKTVLAGVKDLTKEQQTEILTACGGEDVEVLNAKEKESSEKTAKQLVEANKTIKALESTKETLEGELKTTKETHTKTIQDMTIRHDVENYLRDNGAIHPDLLIDKFDINAMALGEDGKITNLDEIGKGVQSEYQALFAQGNAGRTPLNPDTSGSGGNTYEDLVKKADNMTAEQVAAQWGEVKF